MKKALNLKEEAFRARLAGRSVEASDRYCFSTRATAKPVMEAKTGGGVEFRVKVRIVFNLGASVLCLCFLAGDLGGQ